MIRHHPPLELLLDYAAGVADEGVALVVASHASLCASCAGLVRNLEAVGGELLESIAPAAVSGDALSRLMERLDDQPIAAAGPASGDAETRRLIPLPLRHHLGSSLDRLAWRRVGPLLQEFRLPLRSENIRASLVKVRRASLVPCHSHPGLELTLVLAGGYRDDDGNQYARGDVSVKDDSDSHRPEVDGAADCLCLTILHVPPTYTGGVGDLIDL